MSNSIKHSGGIILKPLASDPADATDGLLYYNSTTNSFKMHQDGGFKDVNATLTGNRLLVTDANGHQTTSSVTDAEAGYLSGVTSAIQTQLDAKMAASLKGAASGVAELDASGKVPAAQIPAIAITDVNVVASESEQLALTNQEAGDVAKRTDITKTFIHNGGTAGTMDDWTELTADGDVLSVNGQVGAVSLDTDDISEGSTNLYFTDARAKTAVVVDNTTGSQTDQAASVRAVKQAIADSVSDVVDDTTPQLGGDLDVNGKAIEDANNDIVIAPTNSVHRAKQASKTSFIEEEYIHEISLLASQTATVLSALSFDKTAFEAIEIVYKIKEATTNNTRFGTIRAITDGTNVSINDMSVEAGGDTGVTFSIGLNNNSVEIKYTSGSNAATMRCDVKRIKA